MSISLRLQKIFMDAFMTQHSAGTKFQIAELTDSSATFVTVINECGLSDSMIVGRFRLVDNFEQTPNVSLEEAERIFAIAEDIVGKNEKSVFEDNQVLFKGFDMFVIRRNRFVIGREKDYVI